MSKMWLLGMAAPSVALAVPLELQQSGRLFDGNGAPLNGAVTLDFALHADASTAAAVWSEQIAGVQLQDGYYNVLLGPGGTPSLDTVFDGSSLWLSVSVSGTELAGRTRIVSVPYAIQASRLAGPGASLPVGDNPADCDSTTDGQIRYDGTTLAFCTGSEWRGIALTSLAGTSRENAALSCNALLAVAPGTPDGTYWIDPNGGSTTDALQAWCDMRTDGGWTFEVHDGLRAYWSFDPTSGSNTADWGSYGGSWVGATNDGPAPATGLGRSAYFAGNDTNRFDFSPAIPVAAASTITFWVRGTGCNNNEIVVLFSDNSWLHDNLRAGTVGGTYITENSANLCTSRLNTWYHMAYVDDGTNQTVYQNGILLVPTTYSPSSWGGRQISHLSAYPGFSVNAVIGNVDEFAVYDRALTQTEIQRLYNNAVSLGRPLGWR